MKGKNRWLMAGLLLALAGPAQAALLLYEGFDYPIGSLSGQGISGEGWVGGWSSGDKYNAVAESLSMLNLPFDLTGGAVVGQDTVNRDFDGIDFSQEGVYFISFIMKRTGWGAADGGGEWFNFHLRDSSYGKVVAVGISSGEEFHTTELGATVSTSGGQAATTNAYFMVAKVVTHSVENDEVYLRVYSESDTVDLSETANWTLVGGTEASDALATKITLWAGSDNDDDGLFQAWFDELRIGTTWGDVVPAPSSDLLLFDLFDYAPGESLSGQNGGSGWNDAWGSGDNYAVTNGLDMSNLPFDVAGEAVAGQSTINRDFPGIDFGADGTNYIGFIMKRTGWGDADGGGEFFDFHLRDSSFNKIVAVGISSGEEFHISELGDSVFTSGGQAASTNAFFVVIKVVTRAVGNDEVYLKAYSEEDTIDLAEAATWTLSGTGTNDALASRITLWAGTDDDADGLYQAWFDELRIGTSWEAVVPATTPLQATIMGLEPVTGNLLKMVVNAPTPAFSRLFGKDALVYGSWTNIAQSIDGNDPFVVTNMEYSAVSGSDRVIYVKANEATRFFKVDTEK